VRSRLSTGIVVTAAISAAVALYVGATLPPRALNLEIAAPATHVSGAYHIHSVRSDGTGTVDEIAAAAARAGLGFIILTDHGDGTRVPDPPSYRHGVLTIDAVEINTREGHVVALGLAAPSPYPLAGLSTDVIADVHRMGGLAVLAHPDSPRTELSWRATGNNTSSADGVEWLNVDSEWRDESTMRLIAGALHAAFRPAEAIASLFSRPERSLQRWDNTARTRPFFGLAALDAHASIAWREQEEPRTRSAIARPSYEQMFRTLVQTVVLDAALTGNATTDATRVVEAIGRGRSYSTVRGQAWPSLLEFTAEQAGVTYPMGSRLTVAAGPVGFHVRIPSAAGARVVLLRNGADHTRGQGSLVVPAELASGAYRVEVYLPGGVVPWLMSNPIVIEGEPTDAPGAGRLGGRGRGGGVVPLRAGEVEPEPVALTSSSWSLERDPSSDARLSLEDGRLRFDYVLGTGTASGQYAALVYGDAPESGVETLRFTAAASAPVRVSVQVRLPEGRGRGGQRWRTSIYLEPTPRRFDLRLQDFEPADRPTARRPIVTPIHSFLIVADTINALPGTSGSVWLSDVELGINRLQ